ncbi:unnamed protein product [Cyclocybe aegerita]|uniref:Uncharacterized protein n=1 Tax=Cyclocybe aegerita TaxID=1973307 RepID=A0A8S0W7A8_CYCAE|nr:unnamed protein product [Cyclocybe aegerita]
MGVGRRRWQRQRHPSTLAPRSLPLPSASLSCPLPCPLPRLLSLVRPSSAPSPRPSLCSAFHHLPHRLADLALYPSRLLALYHLALSPLAHLAHLAHLAPLAPLALLPLLPVSPVSPVSPISLLRPLASLASLASLAPLVSRPSRLSPTLPSRPPCLLVVALSSALLSTSTPRPPRRLPCPLALARLSLALALCFILCPVGIAHVGTSISPSPVGTYHIGIGLHPSIQPRELSGIAGNMFSPLMVLEPANPQGLSERELLVLHAEIKALQAHYGLSYQEAAHRLEIAEIKELEANDTAMKAFAAIEEHIKNTIIHDLRPPITRIDRGDFDNINFAKGTIGAGGHPSSPRNASSSKGIGTGQ